MTRLIAATLVGVLVLVGCGSAPSSSTNRPAPGDGSRTPARLPEGYTLDGPIATPAITATRINASVRAVIEPLGTIPFDGLVLPLVSPDGTRIVTQTGTPPTWGTALAEPGAGPSLRTRLVVFDITSAPPQQVRLDVPIDAGVLLGRSCDARGFLVEEPRPDGSRRVGLCSWTTGAVDWFADVAGVVYSGATMTADGDVVATRRAVGSPDGVLWSRRLGALADETGVLSAFPVSAGVPGEVGALALTPDRGTTVTWWTYASGQPIVRARRRLVTSSALIGAYQATDPFRSVAPPSDTPRPGALLFHPGAGRVVLFEPTRSDFVPFADNSISGCWAPDASGWAVLLTTPEGLVHQRLYSVDGVWETLPPAGVLADVYVPRATRSAERPFVLFGPSGQGVTRRLSVVGLQLLSGDDSR